MIYSGINERARQSRGREGVARRSGRGSGRGSERGREANERIGEKRSTLHTLSFYHDFYDE